MVFFMCFVTFNRSVNINLPNRSMEIFSKKMLTNELSLDDWTHENRPDPFYKGQLLLPTRQGVQRNNSTIINFSRALKMPGTREYIR